MRISVFYTNLDSLINELDIRFKQYTRNVISAIGLLVNLDDKIDIKYQFMIRFHFIFLYQRKIYIVM